MRYYTNGNRYSSAFLRDIGHDETAHDITYENAQGAVERELVSELGPLRLEVLGVFRPHLLSKPPGFELRSNRRIRKRFCKAAKFGLHRPAHRQH